MPEEGLSGRDPDANQRDLALCAGTAERLSRIARQFNFSMWSKHVPPR